MKHFIFIVFVIVLALAYRPVPGDINENWLVDDGDYVLVKNHILKIEELNTGQRIRADVNKDGKINSTDIAWIKYFMK